MFWVGVFIASLFIMSFVKPKVETPRPASLEDFNVPTAETGRNVPIIYGTVLCKDANTVWYGDLDYEEIKDGGGGK